MSYDVTTTFRPDIHVTVSDDEYNYLVGLGVVLTATHNGAPIDPSYQFPFQEVAFHDIEVNGTFKLNGTAIQPGGVVTWVAATSFTGVDKTGVSDSTTGLQAWLNACANGKIAYLPAGTYLVDASVGLTPPTTIGAIIGDGYDSVIKVKNNCNTGNLLRATGLANAVLENFRLDGNRVNQSGSTNNYGLFLDSCSNVTVRAVYTHSFTGVGFQAYNSDACYMTSCESWSNLYHGFENEQCRGCTWNGNSGHNNDRHGMFVSPGEVGGSGSKNNQVIGNSFRANSQYGLALGTDAQDLSDWLSSGNVIAYNDIRDNTQYGLQLWKQDGNSLIGNSVTNNGFFGIHVYQAQDNHIYDNMLVGNSAASNGAWDEIMLEGSGDNSAHPSTRNVIRGNTFRLIGANKARFCVNEGGSGDTGNYVLNNVVSGTPTGGAYNVHAGTQVSDPLGVQTVSGGQFINGEAAGMDNGFGILRIFSNLPNSAIQFVSAHEADLDWYVNGVNRLKVNGSMVYISNTGEPGTPSGGGALFVQDGSLKFKGSSGTVTTLGPA